MWYYYYLSGLEGRPPRRRKATYNIYIYIYIFFCLYRYVCQLRFRIKDTFSSCYHSDNIKSQYRKKLALCQSFLMASRFFNGGYTIFVNCYCAIKICWIICFDTDSYECMWILSTEVLYKHNSSALHWVMGLDAIALFLLFIKVIFCFCINIWQDNLSLCNCQLRY